MTPTTFDERARTQTQSLLSDAARVPTRLSRERPSTARWRAIAVFAATVLVISGAVVGASIALRTGSVVRPIPSSPGGHWQSFQLPPMGSSTDAVSCPDAQYCVAVDYGGAVFVSTNPSGGTQTWKVTSVDPFTTVPPGESMTGVSCAGRSLCVAVDQSGRIATSTNPGGGTAAWTLSRVDDQVAFSGISCPAVTLCVAVGGFSPYLNQSGVVIASTDPAGGFWAGAGEIGAATGLTAISCPTVKFCVATDGDGDILTSTDPGGGIGVWRVTKVTGNESFTAISCPTVRICVAVDNSGDVVASTNPTGGSGAWTTTTLDGSVMFDSVSCPSAGFCIVGGLSDSVFVTNDPTGGSGAWTRQQVIAQGTRALFGLSCPTNDFCVGVDGNDGAHIYTNPSK